MLQKITIQLCQSLALPSYRLQATPLHITFSTKFVPPGFFTRLITSLASNSFCELMFKFTISQLCHFCLSQIR